MHLLAAPGVLIAIIAAIPLLVRLGGRSAKGRVGGAALMLGLAFSHLFDPAKAEAMETIDRKREQRHEAGHDDA
jgi:alkanesulfonate monooxygenase SsuD/methylene tetrahydromethanopterin reductase-like flavin-dependent oxidoreductase (luciferase family)